MTPRTRKILTNTLCRIRFHLWRIEPFTYHDGSWTEECGTCFARRRTFSDGTTKPIPSMRSKP